MRIKKIVRVRHGELTLLLDSGEQFRVDLRPLIQRGGVFRRLRFSMYARMAKIREKGLYIEWPLGLDIGADSLWERREPQVTQDTVRSLLERPVEQRQVIA